MMGNLAIVYGERIESIDSKLAEIKRLQIEAGDQLIGIANAEGLRRLAGRAMTASATCELAGIRHDLVREITRINRSFESGSLCSNTVSDETCHPHGPELRPKASDIRQPQPLA